MICLAPRGLPDALYVSNTWAAKRVPNWSPVNVIHSPLELYFVSHENNIQHVVLTPSQQRRNGLHLDLAQRHNWPLRDRQF